MELFVIIALQLLMEAQSYKAPHMKVSPDVVREPNSVHLTCESPADVTVIQCYFYANGNKEKDIKISPSCHLSLTGAEVLSWTGVKSPVSLDIGCYYTTDVRGIHKPSPHSPPATLTILNALIKPIMSVDDSSDLLSIMCGIPASVRTDFICNLYTEDGPLTHRSHSQRSQSGEHHCVFYINSSEIFTHKQTVNGRQLSCDYSVKRDREMKLTSPRSDLYTIRGKKRTKRQETAGDTSASEPAEAYSLITSVPDTGLKHPQSHQDSKPGPSEPYSLITSTIQPSDVLVNTQQKKGHPEENENVYHVYCTVADKPGKSVAGDQIYSLAK
ncbi:hypothetical protein IRJ41_012475 [Triplophysa rosa]|uniref:Ig-like domain-containing protein n=1 Tax=Triplophysa rosa TaxID=992332 RepID=A0A9W7TDD0_TRIRA|nr:hypothetical protein IRJ41_012475 [Triplophysa rosa]